MIVCPNCDRHNEDHYKFCLGCGTELSRAGDPLAKAVVASAASLPVPTALPAPSPVLPKATMPERPVAVPLEPAPLAIAVPVSRVEVAPTVDQSVEDEPELPDDGPPLEPPSAEDSLSQAPTAAPEEAPPIEAPHSDRPRHHSLDAEPVAGPPPRSSLPPPMAMPVSITSPPPAVPPVAVTPPPPAAPLAESALDPMAAATPRVVQIHPPEEADAFDPLDTAQGPMVDPFSAGAPARSMAPQMDALAEAAEATVIGDDSGLDVHSSMVSAVLEARRECRACRALVPEGFKFCGVCGTRYEAPAVAIGQALRARLVLIHPDGSEGEAFELPSGECVVGRALGLELFAEDPFLSPRHATFSCSGGRLTVRDEAALNGVFLRLTEEAELSHRDLFRVGQQLLRFEDMRHVRQVVPGSPDGTLAFGSPTRSAWGRLASVVGVEITAEVWTLVGPQVLIGRERGEIRFGRDGFVSGSHCVISTRQGRFFLADQGSTNGTYLRIKGEHPLITGDLLLLGQQLFRVDLDP